MRTSLGNKHNKCVNAQDRLEEGSPHHQHLNLTIDHQKYARYPVSVGEGGMEMGRLCSQIKTPEIDVTQEKGVTQSFQELSRIHSLNQKTLQLQEVAALRRCQYQRRTSIMKLNSMRTKYLVWGPYVRKEGTRKIQGIFL